MGMGIKMEMGIELGMEIGMDREGNEDEEWGWGGG